MSRRPYVQIVPAVLAVVMGALGSWRAFGQDAPGTRPAANRDEIVLARQGHSDYTIVVADDAAQPEKFAAKELQKYLTQISDAQLPLVASAVADQVICVGKGSVSKNEANRLQADLKNRGEDGYVMGTSGKRLILMGNSPRASLYAVYHFLEKYLGCGWCVPGDDTVPRQVTLSIRPFRDAVGPPAFTTRQIIVFPYGGSCLRKYNLPHTDWMAKNRFNWAHPGPNGPYVWERDKSREVYVPEVERRGLYLEVGGHTFNTWLPPDRYAKDHLEYYGMDKDGVRKVDIAQSHRTAVCISNDEVIRIIGENINRWLDENPEVDVIDLWHNDSYACCLCPQCMSPAGDKAEKSAAYTRKYIHFVNRITGAVAQRHPRVLVNLLAYAHTTAYPANAEPIADNVLVGLCLFPRPNQRTMRPLETSPQSLDRLLRPQLSAWRDHAKHFYVYEYYTFSEKQKTWSMVSMIEEDMRFFRKLGLEGISSDQWGPYWYPVNMYAFGKLAWDPNLKGSDLIADFCRRYYGKAAEPMLAYWNLLEEGLRESWNTNTPTNWRDQQRIALVKKALSQAEDKSVQDRVRAAAKLHQLSLGE